MHLYFHVPFCRSRCHYCAFYSIELGSAPALLDAWQAAVFRELDLWTSTLGKQSIQTIFFGGGTPSLLPAAMISDILDYCAKLHDLSTCLEISLEANPESLLRPNLPTELQHAGITRLSIGMQSFNPQHLRTLGRIHSYEQALQAYALARKAGFASISLDLMWGLPEQSVADWLHDIDTVATLAPDHCSCYSLMLDAHTMLAAQHQAGRLLLPDDDVLASMYLKTIAYLEAQGLHHYEISNYARSGHRCQHNLAYWQGKDYLGIGPSAVSRIAAVRYENCASLKRWEASVHAGRPEREQEILTPKIQLQETVMLGLRTAQGLSYATYQAMAGEDIQKQHGEFIKALVAQGYARDTAAYLCLTPEGMLVSNSIIERLMG